MEAYRDYSEKVSEYWFTFARDGKQTSAGLPHWLNDTSGQDRTIVFGPTVGLQSDFMKARLNVYLASGKFLSRLTGRR